MKILDFIVGFYFSVLKKYKLKGLETSVFILTIPFSFIVLAMIFYITKNIVKLNPIIIGVIMLVVFFVDHKLLLKFYLPRYDQILELVEKYGLLVRVIMIIFGIILFYSSIMLFLYSFRYI